MNTTNPQQSGADDWRATPPGTPAPRQRFGASSWPVWVAAVAMTLGGFIAAGGLLLGAMGAEGAGIALVGGPVLVVLGAILHVLTAIAGNLDQRG